LKPNDESTVAEADAEKALHESEMRRVGPKCSSLLSPDTATSFASAAAAVVTAAGVGVRDRRRPNDESTLPPADDSSAADPFAAETV
jgi:hypothetical protein